MNTALSVSGLNEQIKTLLETTFEFVSVEGELSRITNHNSGHIYFTLKDADSSIKCVMFRGNAAYQINCVSAEPYGQGALALAYEQLKKKLEEKGYFDPSHKKIFPKFPRTIILVTSATGAALQDMQRVAAHRWPLVKLIVIDVLVQGTTAAGMIAQGLRTADSLNADAIIVGRGGGSIEDLWPFNEEIVADALYSLKTPVVSAVGHEIDWVLSDYVADMRAPTPSAAMQMLLPDRNELMQSIDEMRYGAYGMVAQRLERKREQLDHMKEAFGRHSIEQRLNVQHEQIKELKDRLNAQVMIKMERALREIIPIKERLDQQIQNTMGQKKSLIFQLLQAYDAQHPKHKNKRGFAQVAREGKVIDLDDLQVGDEYEAMNERRVVRSKVLAIIST